MASEAEASSSVNNKTWTVNNPYIIGHQSVDDLEEEESLPSSKPVNCGCTYHRGRRLADVTFPIPVDTAFTLIFTESKFFKRSLSEQGNYNLSFSPWIENINKNNNEKQRTIKYTVPLNHALYKCAPTTETQSLQIANPGKIYKILVSAVNEDVPYSDEFSVNSLYCLTRGSNENEFKILVNTEVICCTTSWSFKIMKPIIEKNAYEGITKHVKYLIDSLHRYCNRRPSIISEIMDAEVRSLSGNSRSSSQYLNRIRIEEPDHKSRSLHWSRDSLITSLAAAKSKSNSLNNDSLHKKSTQQLLNPGRKTSSHGTLNVIDLLTQNESYDQKYNSIDSSSYEKNGENNIKLPLSKSIRFVLIIIVILLFINGLLYFQLWNLETTLIEYENILQNNFTNEPIVPDDESLIKLQHFLVKTLDTLSKVEYHLIDLNDYINSLAIKSNNNKFIE